MKVTKSFNYRSAKYSHFLIIKLFLLDVEGMVTDHPQAVDVAQEAKEPSAVPDIVELCKTTFDKTADFFNGELLSLYITVSFSF